MKKYFISWLLILAPVMATAQNDTIIIQEKNCMYENDYYNLLRYQLLCYEYKKKYKIPIDPSVTHKYNPSDTICYEEFNNYQAKYGLYKLLFVPYEEYERFNAYKSKNRGAKDDIDKLKGDTASLNKKLQKYEAQIDSMIASVDTVLAKQIEELKNSNETLNSQIDTAYICLEAISYNFLYIPYEAFSIKNIAIPAFNAINNPYIKEAGKVQFSLLQSYETDIKELIVCYRKIEDELDLSYDGIEYVEKIKGTDVYNNYNKYDDWENTYLGKNILLAISRMESFTRKNKTSLKDLIAELEKCLKTEEDL